MTKLRLYHPRDKKDRHPIDTVEALCWDGSQDSLTPFGIKVSDDNGKPLVMEVSGVMHCLRQGDYVIRECFGRLTFVRADYFEGHYVEIGPTTDDARTNEIARGVSARPLVQDPSPAAGEAVTVTPPPHTSGNDDISHAAMGQRALARARGYRKEPCPLCHTLTPHPCGKPVCPPPGQSVEACCGDVDDTPDRSAKPSTKE